MSETTRRCIHDHPLLDVLAGPCPECAAAQAAQAADEARAAAFVRRAESRLLATRDAHALVVRSEQLAADVVAGRITGVAYNAAVGTILRVISGEGGMGRSNPEYQSALLDAWDRAGRHAEEAAGL